MARSGDLDKLDRFVRTWPGVTRVAAMEYVNILQTGKPWRGDGPAVVGQAIADGLVVQSLEDRLFPGGRCDWDEVGNCLRHGVNVYYCDLHHNPSVTLVTDNPA